MAAMVPVTVPMIKSTPTITAFILFVPWGLALVVFIFYLLVVIDFGVNKTLTPIYDLTSDTSAWPVPSVVGGRVQQD